MKLNEKILDVKNLIDNYDLPFLKCHQEVYLKHGIKPQFGAILTSDDLGCISYIKGIRKFAKKIGVEFYFETVTNKDELEKLIHEWNVSSIDGYMVMYPADFGVKDTYFMNLVDAGKDVEGLHYSNLGLLVQFEKFRDLQGLRKLIIPPTAKGIMYLIKKNWQLFEDIKLETGFYPENHQENPYLLQGKKITIINDSLAVGRSLAMMFLNEQASVQVCHQFTDFSDILNFCENSDIVVSAVPSSKFCIPTESLREGVIVVDISFEGNFEYPSVYEKVLKIAPRWDLAKKGNRINDMTLYRLFSNLFYLINARLDDKVLNEINL